MCLASQRRAPGPAWLREWHGAPSNRPYLAGAHRRDAERERASVSSASAEKRWSSQESRWEVTETRLSLQRPSGPPFSCDVQGELG